MKTFDYTKDKSMKDFFDKLPKEKFEDETSGGDIFDVDKELPRKSKVTNHHPSSAEGWKSKLESEDEHFRNIC